MKIASKCYSQMDKIVRYAVIINACQISASLLIAIYSITAPAFNLTGFVERILVCITALVVIWGAALDINEAQSARRMAQQRQMLEEAYSQLEELNSKLRAQRHDFRNHIQVIYSLTELKEQNSALEYMDKVYSDIQKVGRAFKTSIPAINALLAAKMAQCEDDGIAFEVDIKSSWNALPIPGWEMCRVLGNLIDNAMEALEDVSAGKILISMWEDLKYYHFAIENGGNPISSEVAEHIFDEGFSTKGTGRGMGLHIVRELLEMHGGAIALDTDSPITRFVGHIPKQSALNDIN